MSQLRVGLMPHALSTSQPSPVPTVTCYIDSRTNLYHACNVVAGLSTLEERGEIRLRLVAPHDGKTSYTDSSLVLWLEVAHPSGAVINAAIDLFDRSDRFALPALAACDVYCKRSYYEPDLNAVPDGFRHKIRPFGLNYACRTSRSSRRVSRLLAADYLIRAARSGVRGFRALLADARSVQVVGFLRSPLVEEFEQPPTVELDPIIVFQTRLWSQNELGPGESAEEINADRVAIVRALKTAFPDHFAGGLMPTPLALAKYRDLVSPQPDKRREFIRWTRRCLIGVQTRGLHHSLPFKLAEYLAGSKCIVTSPLRHVLPVPPLPGLHYLEFRCPRECVEHCARLLHDARLVNGLRSAAWAYYRTEVQPAARATRLLHRILAADTRQPLSAAGNSPR